MRIFIKEWCLLVKYELMGVSKIFGNSFKIFLKYLYFWVFIKFIKIIYFFFGYDNFFCSNNIIKWFLVIF